jgi:hypothetical protein
MISKRGKKIFSIIIIIATLALILGAILPYIIYTR